MMNLRRTTQVSVEQAVHVPVSIDGRLIDQPVPPYSISVEQEAINFLITCHKAASSHRGDAALFLFPLIIRRSPYRVSPKAPSPTMDTLVGLFSRPMNAALYSHSAFTAPAW